MHDAFKVTLAAFGTLSSHPQRVNAQHPAPADPIAVVRAAFGAYEAKHWGEFAALVHVDALTQFRSQQLNMAEVWEAHSSKDLAHVVYRVHTDVGRFGRTESVEVIPVKRSANGWQLMLNSELSFSGAMSITIDPAGK